MKKLLLVLLFVPVLCFGQYSSYYGTIDVNQNINANVNVNKTVTTIDYGALAAANATRARNRIEASKVKNEKDREAMIAIANDPSKAFDYGVDNNYPVKGKIAKRYGFRKFKYYHKIPHESLFSRVNNGYNYQNLSDNGIETLIELYGIVNFPVIHETRQNAFRTEINEKGLEETMKLKKVEEGKIHNDSDMGLNNAFIHKKDLNRSTVFGLSGYVSTVIAEDDYDLIIIDYYNAKKGDLLSAARATFKADKDEVDFEELEGRRYYFRKLIERTIGSASFIDIKK
jgi:hypothetical protein